MIIQNAKIQFAHAHELKEEYRQKETLFTQRPEAPDGSGGERNTLQSTEINVSRREQTLSLSEFTSDAPEQDDVAALSRRGRALADALQQLEGGENGSNSPLINLLNEKAGKEGEELSNLDAETYQLKSIVESFTGREIKLSQINDEVPSAPSQENSATNNNLSSPVNAEQEAPVVTASLIYQYQESYQEEETSLFNASGSVTLDSGETLDIDFSQFSQRSFYLENSLELQVGEVELTDPLVVNLQGGNLSLSDNKYQFDLDNDGETESINFASANSGFLALDRNNNGEIDNGSELFGALTGNGFSELAVFDEDNNGFIDSGDGVFSQLLFYQKDQQGNDKLSNISNLGIGALYLGHQATPFQVKDNDNELQAAVRSSGLFINDNGTVGSLQQIDLVV